MIVDPIVSIIHELEYADPLTVYLDVVEVPTIVAQEQSFTFRIVERDRTGSRMTQIILSRQEIDDLVSKLPRRRKRAD